MTGCNGLANTLRFVHAQIIAHDHLPGKPAPDTFLAGASCAEVEPGQAAVFEDALAGVEAGRARGE